MFNKLSRNATNNRVWFNIFCDNGTSCYHCAFTNHNTWTDCNIVPDPGILLNGDWNRNLISNDLLNHG